MSMRDRRRTALRVGAVAVAALVAGCALRQAAAPPRLGDPLIVTFWCGPPWAELDDARAAEIAAAGFTVVGAPCEGELDPAAAQRALAVAQRHGLKLLVADHRINPEWVTSPNWQAGVGAAVADYRDAPALAGYFVTDEPTADQFEAVAAMIDALRAADPAHVAYVNLLPTYIPPRQLGTASYDEYLERFVTTVRPALLSYDYYPFGKKKDRSTFFANLAAMRAVAVGHDLPFMLIALAMPHGPYRDPTEAELAWQVFHALAYGARGISYFTYWTPPAGDAEWHNHYGLIEGGRPTLHYFQVARINAAARAIGAALAPYRSFVVADGLGEIGAPFPIGPIAAIEGGPVTAGLFADHRGGLAALLVNRDYRYGVTAAVHLRAGAAAPQAFDPASADWTPAPAPIFRLAPGGAQLLRWPAGTWTAS